MLVVKIIAKECKTSDGKKFFAYAMINPETKRKVDFRFKMNATNQDLIQKTGKHVVVIDESKLSYTECYEYPRFYCDGIERLATETDELSQSF